MNDLDFSAILAAALSTAERGANPNQDLLSAGGVSIVAKAIEGHPEKNRARRTPVDRRRWTRVRMLPRR
jgi:hypothetical protein